MKLLIIPASSSATSINRQLAVFAASQIPDADPTVLDLNDFEMPIYSVDREEKNGIPAQATDFVSAIESADAVILALAEHNGSYTAAFKNVLDWSSRQKQKLWSEKPMLLLATSPGARGAATVLDAAASRFPHMGAELKGTFSLPSFYEKFSSENGITDPDLATKLASEITQFISK